MLNYSLHIYLFRYIIIIKTLSSDNKENSSDVVNSILLTIIAS